MNEEKRRIVRKAVRAFSEVRKNLDGLYDAIGDAQYEVDRVLSEEVEYLERMPESLARTEKGNEARNCIEGLRHGLLQVQHLYDVLRDIDLDKPIMKLDSIISALKTFEDRIKPE